jgi:hypothetical protein
MVQHRIVLGVAQREAAVPSDPGQLAAAKELGLARRAPRRRTGPPATRRCEEVRFACVHTLNEIAPAGAHPGPLAVPDHHASHRAEPEVPRSPAGPGAPSERSGSPHGSSAVEAAADRGDPLGRRPASAGEASAPVDRKPRKRVPRIAEGAEYLAAVGRGPADARDERAPARAPHEDARGLATLRERRRLPEARLRGGVSRLGRERPRRQGR